jgi:hypothetical protein
MSGKLGFDVLQERLPAQFLVRYYTQNTRGMAGVNCRGKQNRSTGTVMLCSSLVKCTRIYLSGTKDAPCLLAHSKHYSLTVCSILHFSFVNLLRARAYT